MSQFPHASFITSAWQPRQFVPDEGTEVAFAGRSNAGKSSAINAIVGRRDFARVSKTPGRTQLINFFALDDVRRLVDLPGYGYARVSKEMREHWRELLDGYFRRRVSLAGLMVIVDSRRGPGDFDWQMIDWARQLGCPAHILLSKADKLTRNESSRALADAVREIGPAASVQLFSATAGTGVDEARQRLVAFLAGHSRAGD